MKLFTTQRQHYQFQNYLMKEKDKVFKKLNSKIYPTSVLDDYTFLKVLGRGSFGQVFAAQNIHNNKVFAVKIVQKKLINKERLKHLTSEIRILSSINFEFVISLECYFTNPCAVFMVLPLVEGGQFFKLLRKVRFFEENAARFFSGQVVLALEYLHYMGIVFRDLKPENLLMDLKGYLKLIDFGFAKHIHQNYSYTFCGTPEYIAPEILLGKGYNLSPDWWSLGILIYEMCNSIPPFTSKNNLLLYEKILAGNIQWPKHFSPDLKSLLEGLIQVNINKRLGCQKNKARDVKFHRWFSSLNWTALWNKKILPPISFVNLEGKNDYRTENTKSFFKDCNPYIHSFNLENIDISV